MKLPKLILILIFLLHGCNLGDQRRARKNNHIVSFSQESSPRNQQEYDDFDDSYNTKGSELFSSWSSWSGCSSCNEIETRERKCPLDSLVLKAKYEQKKKSTFSCLEEMESGSVYAPSDSMCCGAFIKWRRCNTIDCTSKEGNSNINNNYDGNSYLSSKIKNGFSD